MNEGAIDDLFNHAKTLGYKDTRDNFLNLIHTDQRAFNDMFSYAKSKGFNKSEDDFSILIGKKSQGLGKPLPGSEAGPSGGRRLPSKLSGQQVKAYLGKYGASFTDQQYDQIAQQAAGKSFDEAMNIARQITTPTPVAPKPVQMAPLETGRQMLSSAAEQRTGLAEQVQQAEMPRSGYLSPEQIEGAAMEEARMPSATIATPEQKKAEFATQFRQKGEVEAADVVSKMSSDTKKRMLAVYAEEAKNNDSDELDLGPFGTVKVGETPEEAQRNLDQLISINKTPSTEYGYDGLSTQQIYTQQIYDKLKSDLGYENDKKLEEDLVKYFKTNEGLKAVVDDSKQKLSLYNQQYQSALQDPQASEEDLVNLKQMINKELQIQAMGDIVEAIQYDRLSAGDKASLALAYGANTARGLLGSLELSAEEFSVGILEAVAEPFLAPEHQGMTRDLFLAPILSEKKAAAEKMASLPYQSISSQSVLDGLNLLNFTKTVTQVAGSIGVTYAAGAMGGAALVYGDAVDEARKSGYGRDEAKAYGLLNATISGYLEKIGLKGMTKTIVTDAERRYVLSAIRSELKKGTSVDKIVSIVTNKIANSIGSLAKAGTPEGVTEFAQTGQELLLKKGFNSIVLDEGKEGFEEPSLDEAAKMLTESFVVGFFSTGSVPSLISAFSKGRTKYDDVANAVVNGKKKVSDIVETTKALISSGKVSAADGRAFIENLKIAEAAKASLPVYVKDKQQRTRAISLMMERNKLNEEMKTADPDLQSGYSDRLNQIKEELKSIADKKWEAPTNPFTASTLPGFSAAISALSNDTDKDKSARVFNQTLTVNNGLLTKLSKAMESGTEIARELADSMSAELQYFADALSSSANQTPAIQQAIKSARDMSQRLGEYTNKRENVSDGKLPSMNMDDIIGRIAAGAEPGDMDFMENVSESILDRVSSAISGILDGLDVSEKDAAYAADFLYDRYKQLTDLKAKIQQRINNETDQTKKDRLNRSLSAISEAQSKLNEDISTTVKYQQEKALRDEVAGTRTEPVVSPLSGAKQEAAPEQEVVQAQEYDPANEQDMVDDFNSKNEQPLLDSMVRAINSVTKLLAKIAPNVKVYVHSTEEAYLNAIRQEGLSKSDLAGARGTAGKALFTSDGKPLSIHINLALANQQATEKGVGAKAIYHEAAHIILSTYFGADPTAISDMVNSIRDIVPEGISKELDDFVDQYNEADRNEERVVELIEILANLEQDLDNTTVSKIIKAINDIIRKAASALNIQNVDRFLIGDSRADFVDFINSTATALRTGLSSDISKRATEKIQKKYAIQEQAAGEVPVQPRAKDSRAVQKGKPQAEPEGVTQQGKEETKQKKQIDETGAVRPERARERTGRIEGRSYTPLEGAPVVQGASGPDPRLVAVADKYAKENGIDLKRQSEYVKVDVERAKRIAQAYEEMVSNPQDPKVKEAYKDLVRQTLAQYKALQDAGYEFTFFDSTSDPYNGNPWDAMRDLRQNQRMAVYGTYDGYGTDGITASEVENNPMLEDTGLRWKDQNGVERPVLANDLFRAVHDAFGHGLEGTGFRARGEENAWQAHVRLFTGPAVAAITTETRGQNSWLNYGPYGESNRTAKLEDTVFAENKIGLLPEWTWTEGRAGDMEAPKVTSIETITIDGRDYDSLTETEKEEIKASSLESEPTKITSKSSKVRDAVKVEFKEGGHKNSLVKKSDIIDFKSLLEKIEKEGANVWFWTADQLGIGVYSDDSVNGQHYLDAGPSFALDPKNRESKIIWASGAEADKIKKKIAKTDYIFIISGHPAKSKLFNKVVQDYLKDRVEKATGGTWQSFVRKIIELDTKNTEISNILKKYKSYNDLRNSIGSDRKDIINLLQKQLDKKGTPIKKYLSSLNLNFDVDRLRDGFYKDNNFGINEVMLVLKATDVGGKSNHSTYENNVLGDVIGVPDIRVNAIDILTDERRDKILKGIDPDAVPITAAAGSTESQIKTRFEEGKPTVTSKSSRVSNALANVESTTKALEGLSGLKSKVKEISEALKKAVVEERGRIDNLGSRATEKEVDNFFKLRDRSRIIASISDFGSNAIKYEEIKNDFADIDSKIDNPDAKYKKGKQIGEESFGKMYEADGDGILYRGVSKEDYDRIQKQGFIDTDLRGAISEKEGINMGKSPTTSANYLPNAKGGYIIAIDPKGLKLFTIDADNYIRTYDNIPVKNIVKVSEFIGKDQMGRLYKQSKFNESISEAYHEAKKDGSNPELVQAVEELIGKQPSRPTVTSKSSRVSNALANVESTAEALDNLYDTNGETQVEWLARKENNRRKSIFYTKGKDILFKGFGGDASMISDMFGSKYKYFTNNPDYAKSFSLEGDFFTQKGKVEKYKTNYKKEFSVTEGNYIKEVLKNSGKSNENNLTSNDFDRYNDKLKSEGYDVVIIKRVEPFIPSESFRGNSTSLYNVNVEEHLILNNGSIEKIADQPPLLKNDSKLISEAYHKAKKDGSNPELVRDVENKIETEESRPTVTSKSSRVTSKSAKVKGDTYKNGYAPNDAIKGSGNDRTLQQNIYDAAAAIWESVKSKSPMDFAADLDEAVRNATGIELNQVHMSELINDLRKGTRPEYAKQGDGSYKRTGTRMDTSSVISRVLNALEQLATDRRVNRSIINGLKNAIRNSTSYTVENQTDVESISDGIFDFVGGVQDVQAGKELLALADNMVGGLKAVFLARIANDSWDKARATKDQQERNAFRLLGQQAMLQLSDEATEAGRFNSIIYRIQKTNPEFIVQFEIAKIRRQTEQGISKSSQKKDNVNSVSNDLKQAQTDAAQKAASSPNVRATVAAATSSPSTGPSTPPTQKSPSQKQAQQAAPKPPSPNAEVDKRIKELKSKLADMFKGPKSKSARVLPAGIDPETLDILIELAQNYIKKGIVDPTALIAKVDADVKAAGGSLVSGYYAQMWTAVSAQATAMQNTMNAASLAGRIVSRVKQAVKPSPKSFDPIAELLDELLGKATEGIETPKRAAESRLDKLTRLIADFYNAKDIWEQSKAKVEYKIDNLDPMRFTQAEKQAMMDMLDNFFANDLNYFEIKKTPTPGKDATVTAMLKEQMRDKQMKIEEILLQANTKQAKTRQEFIDQIVHDIVAATGISSSRATDIAESFTKEYDKMVTKKQESIIKSRLPLTKTFNAFKRKSTAQRAFEAIKYGMIDPTVNIYDENGDLVDTTKLFCEMFNIPYVDDVTRNTLNGFAEAIAETPPGILRQQVLNDMMLFLKMHQYNAQGSIGDRFITQVYANLLTSTDTLLKAFNSNILMYNFEFMSQAVRSAAKGDFSLIPILTRAYYGKKGVGKVYTERATTDMTDIDGIKINAGDEYYVFGKDKLSLANPKVAPLSGHYEGLLRYSMGINQANAILNDIVMAENFTNNVTGTVYAKRGGKYGKLWGKYTTLAQKGLGALDALTTAAATQARFGDLLFDAIKYYAKTSGNKVSGREVADIIKMIQGTSALVQLDALNIAIAEMEEKYGAPIDLKDKAKKALLLSRVEEYVKDKMVDRVQQAAAAYPWLSALDPGQVNDMLSESYDIASKIGMMGMPPGTGGALSAILTLPGKFIRGANIQYGTFANAPINSAMFILQGNLPIGALITGIRLVKGQRGFGASKIEEYTKTKIRTKMYGKSVIDQPVFGNYSLTWNLEKQDLITKFLLIQAPVTVMTYMAGNAVIAALASMFDDDDEKKEMLIKDTFAALKKISQKDRELKFFGDPLSDDPKVRDGVWKTLPFYCTGAMYGYDKGGYAKMMSLKARYGVEPYTVYRYGKKLFSYRDNPILGAFFMQMGATTDAMLFNESAQLEDTQIGLIMASTFAQLTLVKDQSNLKSIAELTEAIAGQKAYETYDSAEERAKMYGIKTFGNMVSNAVMPAELKNINQDVNAILGNYMNDPKEWYEYIVYRWPIVSQIVVAGDRTGPFGYPLKTQPKRVFPFGLEQFKLPLMLDGSLDIPTVDQLLSTEDRECTALFERHKNTKFMNPELTGYYQLDRYGDYERETLTLDEKKKAREEYKLIVREFALDNLNLTTSPAEFEIELNLFLDNYDNGRGYKRYLIEKVLGDKAKDIVIDDIDGVMNMNVDGLLLQNLEKAVEEFNTVK